MTLRARLAKLEGRTAAPDAAPDAALIAYLDDLGARKSAGDATVQTELNALAAALAVAR